MLGCGGTVVRTGSVYFMLGVLGVVYVMWVVWFCHAGRVGVHVACAEAACASCKALFTTSNEAWCPMAAWCSNIIACTVE